MSQIDNEELVARWEQARSYWRRRYVSADDSALDFASWCAVLWLEGRRLTSSPAQMAIDYLRATCGRNGHKLIMRPLTRTDDEPTTPAPQFADSLNLPQKQRACLMLQAKWGMTAVEISEILDIKPNTVNFLAGEARLGVIFNDHEANKKAS